MTQGPQQTIDQNGGKWGMVIDQDLMHGLPGLCYCLRDGE